MNMKCKCHLHPKTCAAAPGWYPLWRDPASGAAAILFRHTGPRGRHLCAVHISFTTAAGANGADGPVQVLSKDLRTVRALVEDVVTQLGAAGGELRPAALHDAATAMEAIHET